MLHKILNTLLFHLFYILIKVSQFSVPHLLLHHPPSLPPTSQSLLLFLIQKGVGLPWT